MLFSRMYKDKKILENFSCYPCTGLCICKSVVMVGQVISACRSNSLQLMVLKVAAEMAS